MDEKVIQYNRPGFIELDPISIPHLFTSKQDIEISGFFAAILAWGNRKSIINSCNKLIALMGDEPYRFVMEHSGADLMGLSSFKHRTFQTTDLLYFIHFLKFHYSRNPSLESAFCISSESMESRLNAFNKYFFSLEDFPHRTRKHIAAPSKKSTCKRLNMFLRWMVRQDSQGVDFGIWANVPTSQLICPFDVHVATISRQLKLVKRKQNDWRAAIELTEKLRGFDRSDPVKYDFALFGLGIEAKSRNKL